MALISLEAISDEVHTQRRLRQRRLRLPLRTPGVGADDDHDLDMDDELSDMPSASLGTCRCCVHRFNYWRSGVVVSRHTAGAAAISRQLAAAGVALVTSGAVHHLQTGRPDLQDT